MSQSLAICPICLSAISTEGDHKMSSLTCGHLFGFVCIYQWLEHKNECPICRQEANVQDIVGLVWNGKLPSDDVIEKLAFEKDQILGKKQELEKELKKTKSDLNKTKDLLKQAIQSQEAQQTRAKVEPNPVKYNSIIYERNIVDAFRLHVGNNLLYVTQRMGNKYGVTITSLSNFRQGYFISIHDGQIRDLSSSPDFSSLVTVSIDKSISIVNTASSRVLSQYNTTVPLWSCCWASQSLVAAGGNDGKLFIRDVRIGSSTDDSLFAMGHGPPLFSVMSLSPSRLLCVSPTIGRYFDLRNNKFEPNMNTIGGGILACSCNVNSSQPYSAKNKLVLVASRILPNSGKCTYYRQQQDGLLNLFKQKNIKYFNLVSRPSMVENNGVTYTIFPDEDTKDFCIFPSNNPGKNLWGEISRNFQTSVHPSPILDTYALMDSPSQMMIFSLSSSLLKINLMKV